MAPPTDVEPCQDRNRIPFELLVEESEASWSFIIPPSFFVC